MADDQEDQDLEAIKPKPMAMVAGAGLALVGAFTLLLGAQTYSVVRVTPLTVTVCVLMILLGAGSLGCGMYTARMRGWAALGGAIIGGLVFLLGGVWFLFALLNGLVSLLALAVPPAGLAAGVLSAINVGDGRKADAARSRLRESGLEAGV